MQLIEGLTAEQRVAWERDGFLVLPGLYSDRAMDELDAVTDWMWRERPRSLVVDDTVSLERNRLHAIATDRKNSRLKLNDLYLLSETVRSTVLHPHAVEVIAALLGDDPVLINTLSIDYGTTQDPHVDSLFMTPTTDDALVATWIALEDVHEDAGPLFYYPGSHHVPAYRFSTGLQTAVHAEMDDWWRAVNTGMRERGIERNVFLAKKGDCFIWHARLVHGGSPIFDRRRTRKSIVSHFFTKTDCYNHEQALVRCGPRGYWLNRAEAPSPPVGDVITIDAAPAVEWPRKRQPFAGRSHLDFVEQDGTFARTTSPIVVRADRPFTLRGWALDACPLAAVGIVLPDGRIVMGRAGLGRPDLVTALQNPALHHAGFLARVPAHTFPPGEHRVRVAGVSIAGVAYDDVVTLDIRVI
jgi:hypothetical protein